MEAMRVDKGIVAVPIYNRHEFIEKRRQNNTIRPSGRHIKAFDKGLSLSISNIIIWIQRGSVFYTHTYHGRIISSIHPTRLVYYQEGLIFVSFCMMTCVQVHRTHQKFLNYYYLLYITRNNNNNIFVYIVSTETPHNIYIIVRDTGSRWAI